VVVPAGTASWTSTLTITKGITLQGAGDTLTMITDGVSGGGTRDPLITINIAQNIPFRMTGFKFLHGTSSTAKSNNARISATGNSHSFRIDHCTFYHLHGLALNIGGFLWGVIDHCRFDTLGDGAPIYIGHKTWNGKNHVHGSWADDPYWGSEKFVFIEDNVFENVGGSTGGGIDSFEGARFVVRYNKFHDCILCMHGTEGQGRRAKQVEEYNNTYINDKPSAAGQIRSGCIISHDNTWTNVEKGHVLQAYRLYDPSRHWGAADGQNNYDDNASNGKTGYWATGTHTGAAGATDLTDSNPKKTWWDDADKPQTGAWPINRWYSEGAAYIIRNISREVAQNTRAFAKSNTVDTITCSAHTKAGDRVTFDPGDTYQIWKVVHSLDQPGLGKGDLLTGLPGRPAKWPHQVTEPCYSWNNTLESGTAINLFSSEPSIKEGRDFFNETLKPGYKPYTYPHPLVSGTPASVVNSTDTTSSSNK
jgi:hypothetical protein